MVRIIDTLDDFAHAFEALDNRQSELSTQIESMEYEIESIGDVAGEISEKVNASNSEESSLADYIEYDCPHCGEKIYYDIETFEMSDDKVCPACGGLVFIQESEGEKDES